MREGVIVNVGRQADEEVGIMTRSKCECEGKSQLVMRARKVIQGVKGRANNSLQKAAIAQGMWGCNLI